MTKTQLFASLSIMLIILMTFKYLNKSTNTWFSYIQNKTAKQITGTFSTTDKAGVPIILDWEKIAVNSPRFKENMITLSDIVARAHTRPVVQLIQQKPEVVLNIPMFQSLKSYFDRVQDAVDWNFIEEKIMDVIASNPNITGSTESPNDICWFVIARENFSKKPLGFIQILLSPTYTDGTIKVKKLMIYPNAQHRSLGKLLISSIFKLLPDVQRIILNVLCSNNQAIQAYKSYGFKQYKTNELFDPKSINSYELHFQYLTHKSDQLQKTAYHLIAKLEN